VGAARRGSEGRAGRAPRGRGRRKGEPALARAEGRRGLRPGGRPAGGRGAGRGGAVSARRRAECSGPRPGHVRTRGRGPRPPRRGAWHRPPELGSPRGRGYGAGGCGVPGRQERAVWWRGDRMGGGRTPNSQLALEMRTLCRHCPAPGVGGKVRPGAGERVAGAGLKFCGNSRQG
jgi:hypothetical protein